MPNIATTQVMQFHSGAVGEDDLQITALSGNEKISAPYEFYLELASKDAGLDAAAILKEKAHIAIKQGVRLSDNQVGARVLKIHGVIRLFEQTGKDLEWVKYRAVLVPTLWKASQSRGSRVFQDKKLPDILKEVCQHYDIELDASKLAGSYKSRPYVVQYEETDLDFMHRWMEREGIFYYFEQTEDGEKMVLGDSPEAYGTLPGEGKFQFKSLAQEKGVEAEDSEQATDDWFKQETVNTLQVAWKQLPKKVILNDYNWRTPTSGLKVEEPVSNDGVGEVYIYNQHYETESEGKALAKLRAQEWMCRQVEYLGHSDGRGFRAGYKFKLTDHFNGACNIDYLLVEVSHSATQGLSLGSGGQSGATYHNSFLAIPKSKEFRPRSVTPWPKISGYMHARVDGADGSTPYSQLDDQGRYKIRMPLDVGQTGDGSASKYVRKGEAYAGPGQGMHFPLLRNSEVMMSHVDGDPDRPIIACAVFNPDNPSVVTGSNGAQNIIQTPIGSKIIFDDTQGTHFIRIHTKDEKCKINLDATDGSEAITIKCSVSNGGLRIGKAQGEPTPPSISGADGTYLNADGDLNNVAGANINFNSGANTNIHVGANKVENIVGNFNLTVAGNEVKAVTGEKKRWTTGNEIKGHGGTLSALVVGADTKVVIGGKTDIIGPFDSKAVMGVKTEWVKGMKVTIGTAKEKKLFQGASSTKIAAKWETEALGDCKVTSAAGAVTITGQTKITLKCGGSLIELTPAGIKIKSGGSRTTLGSAMTQMKAPSIKLKSQGALECSGKPGGQYK